MDKFLSSHVAFADESYTTAERFRSVAAITLDNSNKETITKAFSLIVEESGIEEFKWKNLRQARERFAAIKIIDKTIILALNWQLRVDVLIWDTYDYRHQIQGRDDIANLQRMYYHLFKNVLINRWSSQSTWGLFPDENSALKWSTVQDYLDKTGLSIRTEKSMFDEEPFNLRLSRDFKVTQIEAVSSELEVLCQVADFYAGVGAFSYSAYPKYNQWLEIKGGQLPLGIFPIETLTLSNRDRERFLVIKYLNDVCKKKKLGVSLKTRKGFRTFNPKFPINFWMYEPQNPEDKAPTNKSKFIEY